MISWRERRIRGRVVVAADVDSVWSVLTDYDRLADFIPNLVYRLVGSVGFFLSFSCFEILVWREVERFLVRTKGGYGLSKEDCRGHCIGTLRRELFWICRSFLTR